MGGVGLDVEAVAELGKGYFARLESVGRDGGEHANVGVDAHFPEGGGEFGERGHINARLAVNGLPER